MAKTGIIEKNDHFAFIHSKLKLIGNNKMFSYLRLLVSALLNMKFLSASPLIIYIYYLIICICIN